MGRDAILGALKGFPGRSITGVGHGRPRLGTVALTPRGINMRSSLKVAILAALTSLMLAAPAMAEIRQGSATDPKGDAEKAAPSQDIVSASAEYDTNGQLSVSATVNGDIASGPDTFYSFD